MLATRVSGRTLEYDNSPVENEVAISGRVLSERSRVDAGGEIDDVSVEFVDGKQTVFG